MDNYELLKEILSEYVRHPEKISLEAGMKDLGIDSLDLVDIMLDIEEKLHITFQDQELMEIKTVQDAVDLISKHQQ